MPSVPAVGSGPKTITLILATAALPLLTGAADAELIYGLTTENSLTVFDSNAPSVSLDGGFISGLVANENLLAIDFRPATGDVYVLGSSNRLYTLDLFSFQATALPGFSPRLMGTSFGFDFNPAFRDGEFARVISDTDTNRVLSGETGQYLDPVEKVPVFYVPGDIHAGRDPNVVAIAYTNSVAGATSTVQYGIDRNTGALVTIANNAGELRTVGLLGEALLTNEAGLDISGDTGIAYANLQRGLSSELFRIDLATGAASSLGVISSGDLIRDITVVPIPEPTAAAALALGGLTLLGRRRRRA